VAHAVSNANRDLAFVRLGSFQNDQMMSTVDFGDVEAVVVFFEQLLAIEKPGDFSVGRKNLAEEFGAFSLENAHVIEHLFEVRKRCMQNRKTKNTCRLFMQITNKIEHQLRRAKTLSRF
jgi:hypothetical protein